MPDTAKVRFGGDPQERASQALLDRSETTR